ncbi:helix-turn-helix domain-containing protein [Stieleria sp. JC731]|uniref:helix-turn-helix domain-containing protein n=1 Tax=Pirellulaceae TaxID=2691357 RepID=UPI001E40E81C|nr:helix-turn-helix domain-containing protein [Stieleria sp. JC731]MCC9601182.1 helix-turn-helix domain-containing protein [Stieleria sp. JC731]
MNPLQSRPTRGHLIRDRRLGLGLTRQDVANAAGVSVSFVDAVESGQVTSEFASLENLGGILGLQINEMVAAGEGIRPTDSAFANWPWSLSGYIQSHLLPIQDAYCVSENDARNSIAKMRDSWEVHLQNASEDVAEFRIADRLLDKERERYIDRYLGVWRKNDEAVLHATVDERRVGLSVVLPVTDRAYEALRSGKISFMDIGHEDILPESQNIVLDSAVEFPLDDQIPAKRVANAISFAVFYQIAVLSVDPSADDFRLISFAASSTNIQRLAAIGFVDQEIQMPDYGYQICEFLANNADLSHNVRERSESLSFFAGMFRRWVAGDRAVRRKRRMILGAISIFQKIVKSRRRDRTLDAKVG